MKQTIELIIAVLIAQTAGIIGAFFTAPAIPTWYAQLEKPDFHPPDGLFGPVWVALYTLMGVASFLVWRKRGANPYASGSLVAYAVHLMFNALWPVVFFGLRRPDWAFALIVVLWAMILTVMVLFFRVDRRATYLMLPYILWVSYAAVLNFSILQLN
jgi:translocator protein